jgi:hypothetical protein
MKRTLSLLLALALVTAFIPAAVAAADPDVSTAPSWAHEGIRSAVAKGFVPADIQGDYGKTITRQEFCRLAVQWIAYVLNQPIADVVAERGYADRMGLTFSDTKNEDIMAAYRLGVTAGSRAPAAGRPGQFDPDGGFSREQAATMIMNVCRVIGADISEPPVSEFSDMSLASNWAHDAINFARAYRIMSGVTTTSPIRFDPKDTYTRTQSIVTFNNINAAIMLLKSPYTRQYTDNELRGMLPLSGAELKAKISTVADALAFLNMQYPTLLCSGMSYDYDGLILNPNIPKWYLRSGEEVFDGYKDADGNRVGGRDDVATAMAYLLSDNYEIGSLYGLCDSVGNSMKAANYILLDGVYYVFNPVHGMDGDIDSRGGEQFTDRIVTSLDDYINEIGKPALFFELDSVYAIQSGQEVRFNIDNQWATVVSPVVEPLFVRDMTGPGIDLVEIIEINYDHIIAENIHQYRLPTLLGGLTLTVEEAKTLVGKTAVELKSSINTAGDLFLYMLAARVLLRNGCECLYVDGDTWHYNVDAHTVISSNLGNCGSMANLANFLLEGDYDEIGFILHSYPPGGGGGHVYNYIKYEGKYYIVDFSIFLFSNYSVADEFNVIALDKLEDYGTRWGECFGGLAAIIAHTSPGTHIPNIFGEDSGEAGIVYYPTGTDFTILYETPGTGIEIRTKPCPAVVPDWTKPQ